MMSAPGAPGAAPEERARRGIVRVLYSPRERFRRIVLEPGQDRSFGRDERAGVAIADDAMQGEHFQVHFDGVGFLVRARGTAKISVDGRTAAFGLVGSGGVVTAGKTTFRLFLERRTPPESPEPAPQSASALDALAPARDEGTLYGVFDAARDPRVLALLEEGIDEHASLYEGAESAAFDDVCPYLVRFSRDSRLLERIVREGWGRAWGIFARSTSNPKDVRRHFRRFLMVKDETKAERMYFRFYDPRVFGEFFSVATPRQRDELLDGLSWVTHESETGDLVRIVAPRGMLSRPPGGEP